MTQEWFESADLEKKSAQTKSEIQSDQPETSEAVETELQASEETPVSPKESEKHEEEAPETIEEAQTEEEGEGKAEEEHNQENSVKEKSILSKALESPYIPDIDPRKTARFKEEIALFWTWLLDAIQEPTASKTTDQRHRYSVFALLTLLSSINLFFSIYHYHFLLFLSLFLYLFLYLFPNHRKSFQFLLSSSKLLYLLRNLLSFCLSFLAPLYSSPYP